MECIGKHVPINFMKETIMSTKPKTPAKKTVKVPAVAVKKITNTTMQQPGSVLPKPIAKALTVKAAPRTQVQEKTVTKAIKALEQPKVIPMTPAENKKVEKKLDVVMKKTQTVMKKEIAKAPARTPAQEKVVTAVIKDLKTAKKTLATDIKKVVKAKPVPKPVFNKVPTKDLLKDMENNIAKVVS